MFVYEREFHTHPLRPPHYMSVPTLLSLSLSPPPRSLSLNVCMCVYVFYIFFRERERDRQTDREREREYVRESHTYTRPLRPQHHMSVPTRVMPAMSSSNPPMCVCVRERLRGYASDVLKPACV